ncbi:aspartyl-phosphate phosphatase Spo0E family protein [Paenibacillus profundus]|uniref:Aspartyl-phosphate phosphatase Spo0E family protein n=1 Tax=Paenibacillus profundus TaxID=1173085 RepID=A0ABS8YJC9_9BACL|nr:MULTISPECIES: aspartyl-phosphate phosphatase Spo0E family protein [Paenibacillus]MCE5172010.1 aspartyl-phosphate phosphatase Spo0E family protein [Paenibacillus profundus]MCM3338084.1 aspartyl-phosphate phosphatase Spo0E family protein [Paenibacillus sp. MER TA 81-3]
MFCSNYTLTTYSRSLLREDGSHPKWSGKTRNVSSKLLALENEIIVLRKQMEQMFQEEQSFTAENVIEISSMLDLKINEYMKSHVKK